MEAPRANRKTDAVQTPILDYRNCGGNICCWFGKLRSILFQSRSADSDSRELMSSLWLGLSHVAGNPRMRQMLDTTLASKVRTCPYDNAHRAERTQSGKTKEIAPRRRIAFKSKTQQTGGHNETPQLPQSYHSCHIPCFHDCSSSW